MAASTPAMLSSLWQLERLTRIAASEHELVIEKLCANGLVIDLRIEGASQRLHTPYPLLWRFIAAGQVQRAVVGGWLRQETSSWEAASGTARLLPGGQERESALAWAGSGAADRPETAKLHRKLLAKNLQGEPGDDIPGSAMTLRALASELSKKRAGDLPGRLADAKVMLRRGAMAVTRMADRLGEEFCLALDLVVRCRGRVVVSGVGKSGLIGRKISSTLACTGTPSFFLHPIEAAHGDLGMVTPADVVILVSNSGETGELLRLVPYLKENDVPIIAFVGSTTSTLARRADVSLDIGVEREACPYNLVPTSSALTTLAMGDALALAAMAERDFRPEDFARIHPGGALGQRPLISAGQNTDSPAPLPVVSLEP